MSDTKDLSASKGVYERDPSDVDQTISDSKDIYGKDPSDDDQDADDNDDYSEREESPYAFIDPQLADKILSQLDIFEPVPDSYLSIAKKPINRYDEAYMGLKNDPEYCNKHRAYMVEHPEVMFQQMNIVIEHGPSSLLRKKVVRAIGTDIMPNVGRHMNDYYRFAHNIKPEANLFFSVTGMQKYKHVGQHFSCLSQEFNHFPGHFSLNRKDTIAEGAINYGKKFEDRPQCFNNDKYFPRTWLLYKKDSCKDFFAQLKTPEHAKLLEERKIVYIKKVAVGSHRGNGVTPLHAKEEKKLIDEYKGGNLCGRKGNFIIVQSYIHKPLLLNGHKFDFKMYMVTGSSIP